MTRGRLVALLERYMSPAEMAPVIEVAEEMEARAYSSGLREGELAAVRLQADAEERIAVARQEGGR